MSVVNVESELKDIDDSDSQVRVVCWLVVGTKHLRLNLNSVKRNKPPKVCGENFVVTSEQDRTRLIGVMKANLKKPKRLSGPWRPSEYVDNVGIWWEFKPGLPRHLTLQRLNALDIAKGGFWASSRHQKLVDVAKVLFS